MTIWNFVPLVCWSGRTRKLMREAKNPQVSRITLPSLLPGGPEAFDLAARFCSGVDVEITQSNVAMLRCAAHYLEMTGEYADKGMETRTEAYLKEEVFPNLSKSISVLHSCETLFPAAEETNMVSRLINAIANNAFKEQLTSGLLRLDNNFPAKAAPMEPGDWWGEAFTALSLDFFQRVLSAVKTKGLHRDMVSNILINYAHSSLQCPGVRDTIKGSLLDLEFQRKQRDIVEVIVSLLPTQSRKSPVPMAFLSSLLRKAIAAFASTSCRSDLERRIGLQLDQANLVHILIPSNSHFNNRSTIYDTDSILRIFAIFFKLDKDDEEDNHLGDDYYSPGCPKQSSILKVSKLLDDYLAQIALDPNLMTKRFTALAELLPDDARIVSDGLYKAVDTFLKAHPNIKDCDLYRLCKTINCQKLSQHACSHLAQNERLPVQMAVHVLYLEQMRVRNEMNGTPTQFPRRSGSGAISPALDNYASVMRENTELKRDVAIMRMRLADLEKDHASMKQELVKSHPAKKLFKSFTKKLGKVNSLFKINSIKALEGKPSSESRCPFQRAIER